MVIRLMQECAMLFPGQGSQSVGMGLELANTFKEAAEIFDLVDDTLGEKLSEMMFYGEQEELTMTKNAQPAIMAVSLAIVAILKKQFGLQSSQLCKIAAGHSLGEYSALAAAEVFSVTETAKLLRSRGEAMQSSSLPGIGAMLALIGADLESANKLCEDAAKIGVCEIANDNGANQIVLSGEALPIEYAARVCSEFGIKKAIKLKVSAPFHSSLMAPAAVIMQSVLDFVAINKPMFNVLSNVTLEGHTPAITQKLLVAQVTQRVRWRETMEKLKSDESLSLFIEVGPGQVLGGIIKKMYPEASVISLNTPQNLEYFSKLF